MLFVGYDVYTTNIIDAYYVEPLFLKILEQRYETFNTNIQLINILFKSNAIVLNIMLKKYQDAILIKIANRIFKNSNGEYCNLWLNEFSDWVNYLDLLVQMFNIISPTINYYEYFVNSVNSHYSIDIYNNNNLKNVVKLKMLIIALMLKTQNVKLISTEFMSSFTSYYIIAYSPFVTHTNCYNIQHNTIEEKFMQLLRLVLFEVDCNNFINTNVLTLLNEFDCKMLYKMALYKTFDGCNCKSKAV